MDINSCNLTSAELDLFAATIADLSNGRHTGSPRNCAANALFELVKADSLASYRWNASGSCYHKPLLINLKSSHADYYLSSLQDKDPITPLMRRHRKAMRLQDVVPYEDFERLDFYNDFLRPDNMYHGANVFVRADDRELCDFRIFRSRSSAPFTARDLMLMDAISTYLSKAEGDRPETEPTVLTRRETEVARLVSRGCTDADIERILGISFSTVRSHINNCFEKLGCANRSELAAYVVQRGI